MRPHFLSQSYGWPTTRRHPRSLAEAFPCDHADPIEHHPSVMSWVLSDLVIAAILIAVIVLFFFGVLA